MTETESMQSKIEKLLTKAERTDNPHEAEAYTRKAEKLMVAWGISEAMLQAGKSGSEAREAVVEETMNFSGSYAQAMQMFGHHVASALGLRTLISGSGNKRNLHVIGHKSDVTRASMLITSLHLQANSAMRTWWSGFDARKGMTENEKFLARRTFLLHFSSEVATRLRAAQAEAEAEAQQERAAGATSVALVLADRSHEVDAWMAEAYPRTRTSRSNLRGSNHGALEGRAAGRAASLGNRESVGSDGAAALSA